MMDTNLVLKYTNQEYLINQDVLVEPCNLHQALAYILNEIGEKNKHWKILIEPSEMEYFKGTP